MSLHPRIRYCTEIVLPMDSSIACDLLAAPSHWTLFGPFYRRQVMSLHRRIWYCTEIALLMDNTLARDLVAAPFNWVLFGLSYHLR